MLKIKVEDLDKNLEWPVYEYCVNLINKGTPKDETLEVWNYSREIPEADYVVQNIGFYVESCIYDKKRRIRKPRLSLKCL